MGSHPDARFIRENCVILVMPLLDPDGAAKNVYNRITHSFHPNRHSDTALEYAEFFLDWVNKGHRLDVAINLHNVESNEGPHVFPYQFEGDEQRLKVAKALHQQVYSLLTDQGYRVRSGTGRRNISPDRLGGFVMQHYATLHQFYEMNTQAPNRHLSLYQLKGIGAHLIRATAKFMTTNKGQSFLRHVTRHREHRAKLYARYGQLAPMETRDAMMFNSALEVCPIWESKRRQSDFQQLGWLKATENRPFPELWEHYDAGESQ